MSRPIGDVTGRPLVSAITIFYNAAPFLPEAIESVLAQTCSEWELLLVDDGSTDGSSEIAREYARRHEGRIRYLEHTAHRNCGMSASRNLGWRQARGAFVAFLDGDDLWLPQKLERQLSVFAEHPEVGMTCGATRVWHGWTGVAADAARDSVRLIHREPDGVFPAPEMLRRFLRDRALTPATCSVMIRREAFAITGGFEERFTGLYEDQAFFVKAYLTLACHVTSDTNDLYRQHPESHVARALRDGRYSPDRPTHALRQLHAWCVWYFVRRRVSDRQLWSAVLGKLRGITVDQLNGLIERVRKQPARAR